MAGMRDAIEGARRQAERTSDLASAAHGAHERYEDYREKGSGSAVTSFGRLRELEQERDLADDRLRRAQTTGKPPASAPAEPAVTSGEEPLIPLDLSESSGPDDWDRL
jgi:hypothetical protein